MCSIDGFTRGAPFSLRDYAALNAERGPDGTTYFEDEHIHMAHSLLSISPNESQKTQPLISGSKVFSYVGEIYGLEEGVWDTGWLFELILSGRVSDLTRKTSGMWAWTLYDAEEQTLTLCRDHFGVKGLYYMELDGVFYWSSTMKPLIATLNTLGYGLDLKKREKDRFLQMESYYRFTNVPYVHIHSLPPGQLRKIDLKTFQVVSQHSMFEGWDISDNYFYDDDEYKEIASECLIEAMTAPKVPKALGLSGGLDSTLLASLARKDDSLMACTISYEDVDLMLQSTVQRQFNEAGLAEYSADYLGIPCHTHEYLKERDPNWCSTVHRAMGATSFDIGRLGPRYANIKQAHEQGAKIFFGGDCADELLTGYTGDQQLYLDRHITYADVPPMGARHQAQHIGKMINVDNFTFSSDAKTNYMFRRLIWASEGFSTVADFIAGSFGMESRMPFLHQRYVQYVARIPMAYRLKSPIELRGKDNPMLGCHKRLIRDVFHEEIPPYVRQRQNKCGFSIPWDSRNKKKNDAMQEEELKNSLDILNYRIGE